MRVDKRYILINRVFSGTYLSDHIGHELINFLADDHGTQWCFVNKNGEMPLDKYNKVDWVINVILIRRGVFEVLNAFHTVGGHIEFSEFADRKRIFHAREQSAFLNRLDVKYGGVPVTKLYNDGAIVTYRVPEVYVPKKRIVISHLDLTGDALEQDAIRVKMTHPSGEKEKQLGNQSPRTYIVSTDASYGTMLSLLGNQDYFKKGFLPQVDDLQYGIPLAYCEKDADLIDLTMFHEQKRLFLEKIESLKE